MFWMYWDLGWSLFFGTVWFMTIASHDYTGRLPLSRRQRRQNDGSGNSNLISLSV